MNNKKILKQKGFTLIEMLVVVIIIAIMATIILGTVYNSSRDKAADSAVISSIGTLAKYMESKRSPNGFYPTLGYGINYRHAQPYGKLLYIERYSHPYRTSDKELDRLMNRFIKLSDFYTVSTYGPYKNTTFCFSSTLKDSTFVVATEKGVFQSDENYCETISTS